MKRASSFVSMPCWLLLFVFCYTLALSIPGELAAQQVVPQWWKGYDGKDANGEHVLGYWKFDGDGDSFTRDASSHAHKATTFVPLVVTPRPLPHRMPVVMWGVGGTDSVVKEIPRLKEFGFTHCLGLSVDYQKVWDEGAKASPTTDQLRNARQMLNTALENDIKVVTTLAPGSWLRRAKVGKPFLRIDPTGKHYGREDVSGLFKPIQEFCFNTGEALGRSYGDHPALDAVLLHTEVRGESQVSFPTAAI